MITLYVEGVGLYGPGLESWEKAQPVLTGEAEYQSASTILPPLELLPPAERRRTIATVRLALLSAQAAFRQSGRDPQQVATVFASSGGDGATFHHILETLSTPEREISPTRFHNSVHNAPAGYWAIATGSRAPSATLCAHDWTFAAALLEAAVQVATEHVPVGLVVHDVPYLEPLHSKRPIEGSFGVALVFSPTQGPAAIARLEIARTEAATETTLGDSALEHLRRHNPAARSLPLLRALAGREAVQIFLANAAHDCLRVAVTLLALAGV